MTKKTRILRYSAFLGAGDMAKPFIGHCSEDSYGDPPLDVGSHTHTAFDDFPF